MIAASLRCSLDSGGIAQFAVILRQPAVNIEPGIECGRHNAFCFLTADYANFSDWDLSWTLRRFSSAEKFFGFMASFADSAL
jgi:hypothetical protein